MKILFITFLILHCYSITCDKLSGKDLYTVQEAFECINSVQVNSTAAASIKKDITAIFETYVYKDILKNPPAINGKKDYYETVNIDEELTKLSTQDQSLYKFYQNIEKIFFKTHDLHLTFRATSDKNNKMYFDNFYATLPFTIDIKNNGKDVLLSPNSALAQFAEGVPQEIKDNQNIPVKTINGLDPKQWIRDYAEKYTFLKCNHARFTYAIESMSAVKLSSLPIDEEHLSQPIEIVYNNNIKLTTSYKMLYNPPESLSEKQKHKIFAKESGKHFKPIMIDDLIDLKKDSVSTYDFESADGNIACKTFESETEEPINIFVLKTFYPEIDVDNFFETFSKCVKQFDGNEYKIAMILPMNGGGYGDLTSNVENLLAPHEDTALIGAVRISPGSENCIKHEYGSFMSDPLNCSARYNSSGDLSVPLGSFYSEPVPVKYGDVEHVKSQVSLLVPSDMLGAYFEKRARKPHEVILFTDSFCYSACALLTKGMWERGSAIVVGYEGDPDGDVAWFDAGQSPTAVIGMDEMFLPEGDDLAKYGFSMRTSFYEYFGWNYDYNKETIPREFTLSPVDERVHIYKFQEEKLEEFVTEARRIFKKYENECNPLNKRLVKYADECDEQIEIEHAHGGYVCGDDGRWSNVCKAAYCDFGYKWDEYNLKCVVDACYNKEEEKKTNKAAMWTCLCVVVICVLVAVVVGIIQVVLTMKKKKEGYQQLA